MKSKDKKILEYIKEIEEYTTRIQIKDFLDDKMRMKACAFTISQIGGLVKKISDETINRYTGIPWRSIKGMRNRIAHDYENIDSTVLWGTIQTSLPELKQDLEKILKEEGI